MIKRYFILILLASAPLIGHTQIQWASRLLSYSSQRGETSYSAKQVLGPPSKLPSFGDCGCAWTPRFPDNFEDEFIRVAFDHKIHVSRIYISENHNGGAIKSVLLYDQYNIPHEVYTRTTDKGEYGRVYIIDIPKTEFVTNELKLVLETESIGGYNQIDAIGIAEQAVEFALPPVNDSDYFEYLSDAENLGVSVNSPGSELAPILSDDGKRLYFTRKDHPQNTGSMLNDDIWYAEVNGAKTGPAIHPGEPVNNEINNYVIGVSNGGKMLSLANLYFPDGRSGMGVAQTWAGESNWRYPVNLITPGLISYNFYAEYYMNTDRSVLLVSLEKGDGLGLKDLYVCFSDNQLTWTYPMNLGPEINTVAEEMAPSLSPDGRYLIFSSNGYPGYGEQDIYISKRLDDTWKHWSTPQNLGPKVNSIGFDAYFTFNDSSEYAYFTSTRDGYFNPDIYRIQLKPVEEEEEEEEKEPLVEESTTVEPAEPVIEAEVLPDGIVLQDDILLFGTIFDASTEKPVDGLVIFSLLNYPSEPDSLETLNHNYRRKVTDQVAYQVIVKKKGYLHYEDTIVIEDFNAQRVKREDFRIFPIEKGSSFILDKLQFNANSYVIRRESYIEVDGLLKFMLDNPEISIEIGGHTNGLCGDEFCNQLSRQRAESVMYYLINHGVEADRITAIGYGKTRPIASNDTPEGRTLNQRVEITIR